MTKLNLLGAQRVKALTDILQRRYNDEINNIESERISYSDALDVIAAEAGVIDVLNDIRYKAEEIEELGKSIKETIGVTVRVEIGERYWDMSKSQRKQADKIMDNGVDARIARLRRELEEKASKLWLVETLEEAQAIVDSPIEG